MKGWAPDEETYRRQTGAGDLQWRVPAQPGRTGAHRADTQVSVSRPYRRMSTC